MIPFPCTTARDLLAIVALLLRVRFIGAGV